MVRADKNSEPGATPDGKLLAEMMKYNQELSKAGILLAGEGLQPSSKDFGPAMNPELLEQEARLRK